MAAERPSSISGAENSRIIVPNGVRGRRETVLKIFEEELRRGEAPTKYNSQGVNFDDQHNFFFQANGDSATDTKTVTAGDVVHADFFAEIAPEQLDKKTIETVARSIDELEASYEKQSKELAEVKAQLEQMQTTLAKIQELIEVQAVNNNEETIPEKELADNQPRRVQTDAEGKIERMVKYKDGSSEWRVVEAEGDTVEKTDEVDTEVVPSDTEESDEDAVETDTEEQDDPEDPEKTPEKNSTGVPKELEKQLEDAIGRYAELTAKDRNNYVGHFMQTSRFLIKIPGVTKLAEKVNGNLDSTLIEARKQYEDAVLAMQESISREFYDGSEASERKVMYMSGTILSEADKSFEEKLVAERMKNSKKTNRFVNWWVQQSGLGGQLKKYLAVAGAGATAAGVGVAVGAIAGSTLLPGVGSVIGAGVGAYIGNHVAKRKANAVDAEDKTLAQRQSEEDLKRKQDAVRSAEDDGRTASVFDTTDITEDRTARQKFENRKEFLSAVGAGTAGGNIVQNLSSLVTDQLSGADASAKVPGSGESANVTPGASDYTPDMNPEVQPAAPEQLLGTTFDVESGSGYVNELQQFASANGHEISPEQAWEVHQELVKTYGPDYLDIAGIDQDVYTRTGGGVGLSAAGQASWDPGVADSIKAILTNKGLW